jgi:hypothetical protein
MTYALINQLIISHMSAAYIKNDHEIFMLSFEKLEKIH